jgi:hypothetical protein
MVDEGGVLDSREAIRQTTCVDGEKTRKMAGNPETSLKNPGNVANYSEIWRYHVCLNKGRFDEIYGSRPKVNDSPMIVVPYSRIMFHGLFFLMLTHVYETIGLEGVGESWDDLSDMPG